MFIFSCMNGKIKNCALFNEFSIFLSEIFALQLHVTIRIITIKIILHVTIRLILMRGGKKTPFCFFLSSQSKDLKSHLKLNVTILVL